MLALLFVMAAPASAPASEPTMSEADLELMMDRAVETYNAKKHGEAAPRLHFVFKAMPEDELKRDVAQYYLAESLRELGFTQAAVEHYIDIVTGRRSPDMVARALQAIDALVRRGLAEEGRIIDDVLFGAQFGELDKTTQGFVDYYQALGEFRRGYSDWGEARLESLLQQDNHYTYRARFALGVSRLQQDNKEGAEKLFANLIEDKRAPSQAKNDARAAMARLRYEDKRFEDAWGYYSQIDSPPSQQAAILLEKAWTTVQTENEQRSLGMTVGLGAPVYRRSFAPERDLIRAISLNRLCQFRAAHRNVLSFRAKYSGVLRRIRERDALATVPLLVEVARSREEIRELERIGEKTDAEAQGLDTLVDKKLRAHVEAIYATRKALLDRKRERRLETLLEKTADDLLAVDEQMNILDYEIGIGLFKRVNTRAEHEELPAVPPSDGARVFYKFAREYWSDELNDFAVLARDRCVR